MFRFEVDGIDVHATKVSAPKIMLNIIETMEGGDQETTDHTTNGVKPENITVERPLTTDDLFDLWAAAVRVGEQDKRLCSIFALNPEGEDIYRWELVDCLVVSHAITDFDGSTKDQEQKEIVEIKPRVIRGREKLI